MAETANSSITTNLNVAPYYDDFDPSKNFVKNLYRPGYAVQARELTQGQTQTQHQIDSLGRHLFREGSIVLPGAFTLQTAASRNAIDYVKVRDQDSGGNTISSLESFEGETVTGLTSNIKAYIVKTASGSENDSNTKTLMINYLSVSDSNSSITTFQAGEILVSPTKELVVHNTNPTGKGSMFRIEEGVVFAKGFFLDFPTQIAILDRYNDNPTCKVGFIVVESIITPGQDSSLLDPALESSNYSAPGAHRLKLFPELTVVDYDAPTSSPDFVTLFTVKDGIIQSIFERSQYNIFRDEMAKRTYDESGDYYVNGLGIRIREHLDDGTNGGLLPLSQGGNSSFLSIGVEPGLAYVKGYEVGTLTTQYLTTRKATAYENVNSQIVSSALGDYFTANQVTGVWTLDQGEQVDLYDTAQRRLTNKTWSTGGQTGTKIGTAKIKSVEYSSGTLGTPDGQMDIYLFDIQMLGSNSSSSIRSIYRDNTGKADLGADIVLTNNTAILKETTSRPLLYAVGSSSVRTIRDTSGLPDTTFTYKRTSDVTIASDGTHSLPIGISGEIFPYGSTILTAGDKRDIQLVVNQDVSVAMSGNVSNSGLTLNGVGTSFTRLNPGDKIEINSVTGTYYISSIANNTSLTLATALASPATTRTFTKVYKNGDIIDLTTVGADAGASRTVTASDTQLDFDLQESYGGTVSASINYKVSRTSAREIQKTLKPSRYVIIDCSSAGTTGPFGLGFSDIFRVKQIRKSTSPFSSPTDGTLVTDSFNIDNGQRDTFYDHGSITPKISLTASDKLLIELDYFEPSFTVGKGYFSLDSYPVNDTNPSSSEIRTEDIPIYTSPTSSADYDLRNYLDFRPVKSATASDATSVGSATTNPGASTGFSSDGFSLRIPAALSQIIFDYSYYLSRKDVVVVNQDGVFSIITGTPAITAITPSVPANLMALATLDISPYPSLSPYYANLTGRKELSSTSVRTSSVRQTMRDIGVIKDRVVNLEYYAALSLLEKSAVDMKILDENGLDRFKNGIFVDTFSNHLLGATYNPDYRIVVDPKEKSIRPLYTMDSIGFDYISGTNVTKKGDLVFLDYDEVLMDTQTSVTTTRNTERITWRFLGTTTLTPDNDIWVDTQFAPDLSVTFDSGDLAETSGGITTEWDAWRTRITGYAVYRGNSSNPQNLVGTYSTRQEADRIANQLRSSTAVTIETFTTNERLGTETFLRVDQNTQSLGDRVVDVGIIPYIRPQTIKVVARGLKPFAKTYTFFDNQDMTDYVTPINSNDVETGSEGSELRVGSDGILRLKLRLPEEKRFYTGTKKLTLTDSPTNNPDDSTSVAEGYFIAQGLVQQKQETILSTRQVVQEQRSVSQINNQTNREVQTVFPPSAPDDSDNSSATSGWDWGGDGGSGACIGYSFLVKAPVGEEGLFLTSVDVFCADKHPTLGAWFEIRELDSGGSITRNQVPFSEVWLTNNQIPVSTNGIDNPLNVEFETPIFLYNDKQYAFIIHPEAANPNYYFWVSRLGETDINTNQPVTSRKMKGTFYTTNNNMNWDLVPEVDLTINFYRASFDTNSSGQVILGNSPKEKVTLENLSGPFSRFGDLVTSGDKLSLTSISGGTIALTDLIVGNSSNANSAVYNINGSVYSVEKTGYQVGETVTVRYANSAPKGVTATVSGKTTANSYLEKFSVGSNVTTAIISKSNGLFSANDRIYNPTSNTSATISSIDNFRYSTIDVEADYLLFNKTNIDFAFKAYNTIGTPQNYIKVTPNENYSFPEDMAIFSRSNEVTSLGGNRSGSLQVNMGTTSDFISPVLDLGRTHTIFVNNIINNDATDEDDPSGGALYNKYISKIVTLAEGQDAEDLVAVLTSYRPPGSDIKVWVKILHAEDSDSFNTKNWIELEKTERGNLLFSSLANRDDFKEFKFSVPESYKTGPDGQVQYTNSQGTTFTGYKYFSIKIGLLSDNSAVVPRVADLRFCGIQM